ncbi:hypothetical protein KFL_004140040 [Klebsormidium nitens]|uniref:Uncharacterized protein n=1 Tax=Klebsormidium nitens TaxID=105231 RepID=A0A0U9HKH3_KLENI|nr:hypothetical protein KFL_004140040 [Klebsormidium nitens]|eukprot:GAQ88268.1 hypothetical protein KFL_004140040 [Klebsormidium nitens]
MAVVEVDLVSSGERIRLDKPTFDHIASGHFRVDSPSCQERVAVKCLTCRQQLWVKDEEGCLRLAFRKGQQSNGVQRGYLISAKVPRAKQARSLVCLSCIGKLLGKVVEAADGRTIALSERLDDGANTSILQQHPAGYWTQVLALDDALISFLRGQNEGTVERKKRQLTAAEQVINKGGAKGLQPRVREPEAPETNGEERAPATSIKAQALSYLRRVDEGKDCQIFLPVGSIRAPLLSMYMGAWDHNGVGRPKPLGKPDKSHALQEMARWNALGVLCCTCHRGRLTESAPCVHKLVLAALSESWAPNGELPTSEALGQGVSVERVSWDGKGSYYAVVDNPRSPSCPKRRMLFHSVAGNWYCEGKRDGCPSLTECVHISTARAALAKGDVPDCARLAFGLAPFAKAAIAWLEKWIEGELPQIGGGKAVPAEVASQESLVPREGGELTGEQQYLLGLLQRRPHEGAACAGEGCFCKRHAALFGEARPMETEGHETRVMGREEEGGAHEPPAGKRRRRGKSFWEKQARAPILGQGRPAEPEGTVPPLDARGKEAIHGWVAACSSCTLSSLKAEGACAHAVHERAQCPVMLLTTEAIQVSKPKLARPSDASTVHDPLVTCLQSPVPLSELRDCHFAELSRRGLLSAPCPIEAPPCGTQWVEAWVEATVEASAWSKKVRVRLYHCSCLDRAHAVHFDGEHFGLYVWSKRTLFHQQSLQLLLRGMQSGQSFRAVLARDQAAFEYTPTAAVLSEETWRRASLDFFKLVGLGLRDCCSLCGPHPNVLICDGIVGLASADGAQKPGGLGSSLLDAPRDGKLGERLSKTEFNALLNGLAHEDPQTVKRFGPDEAERSLPEDGRRRMLTEQRTMVRDRNLAVFKLLTGIQGDFERRGLSPDLWQHWVGEWTEILYCLGAHDSDEDLIGPGALHVIRRLLLGSEATLEDRRDLARDAPILRRILDAYGGLTFPAFSTRTLYHLYLITVFLRGATGFDADGRRGWVHEALDPFNRAVNLLTKARARPLSIEERRQLDEARGLANKLLPGVERLEPSPQQWEDMSAHERSLLRERLGQDENGEELHPLPTGHAFRAEQDALACYSFPGWEQKRGLPWYSSFEHPGGRSRSSEENKCATGKSMTEWDVENVPGLVKGAGKLSGKKGSASKRPKRSRGGYVFACPHRCIYGFHVMLRGESPRDAFVVLYTRLRREDLPEVVVHDNGCALRNYCMRREGAHFAKVRFVVDRFHFSKAGQEVHKCGPSNCPDTYPFLHWVNTSAVESVNSFLKGFRSLGWYSGLESFMVILPLLLGGYNQTLKRVDDSKLAIAIAAAVWTAGVRTRLLQQ